MIEIDLNQEYTKETVHHIKRIPQRLICDKVKIKHTLSK